MKVLGFVMRIKDAVLKGKDPASGKHWDEEGFPQILSAAEIHRRGGVPLHYRPTMDVTPIVDRGDGVPYHVQPGDPENAYFDGRPGKATTSPDVGVSDNYEANKAGFIPQLGPFHDESLVGQTVSVSWASPDGTAFDSFKVIEALSFAEFAHKG